MKEAYLTTHNLALAAINQAQQRGLVIHWTDRGSEQFTIGRASAAQDALVNATQAIIKNRLYVHCAKLLRLSIITCDNLQRMYETDLEAPWHVRAWTSELLAIAERQNADLRDILLEIDGDLQALHLLGRRLAELDYELVNKP